jgi:hypothetical protein
MSKLNLIHLTKDEITKEEAQKAKGGGVCACPCTCICECTYEPRTFQFRSNAENLKLEDKVSALEVNN